MPKIKSHKAASKRFRLTKGGKGKLTHTKLRGKRRKKSRRVKAQYGKKLEVQNKGKEKRAQKLLPYLKKNS